MTYLDAERPRWLAPLPDPTRALLAASRAGSMTDFRSALAAAPSPDAEDWFAHTPLFHAPYVGAVDKALLLVEAGASVNRVFRYRSHVTTALVLALPYPPLACALLEAGADPDLTLPSGETARSLLARSLLAHARDDKKETIVATLAAADARRGVHRR